MTEVPGNKQPISHAPVGSGPPPPPPALPGYPAQASQYASQGQFPAQQLYGGHGQPGPSTNVYLTAPMGAGSQYSNGMGTTSMILGIVSVTLFWMPWINFVCPVLAVIFGIVGLNKVKNGTANNKGMALAGLILGGLFFIVAIFVVIAFISAVASLSQLSTYSG